ATSLRQVPHDTRTPIPTLAATLDPLVHDALTMPKGDLTSMVARLRPSALRLAHIVENLLDAGSIEAGTSQVRAMPTSVKGSLQEALLFIQPLLDSKRQRLASDLRPDADRVLADPRRTTQVFANLLANASKYAPEATAITISTATRDGFVLVTVKDQGPGIPEDEQ